MQAPALPWDEARRLASLQALGVLDTPPDEHFDALTRLALKLFDVPIALVSLVDAQRQWFKSCQGLPVRETSRDISFCGHAILADEVFVVPDAQADRRFADNPLVVGAPGIRFYAGCPLRAPDGARLGTLCLIDRRPRDFGAAERTLLCDLAGLAELELHALSLSQERDRTEAMLREERARLAQQEAAARAAVRQRDEFLAVLAHELRNPLAPIRASVHLIRLREPSDAVIAHARQVIERQSAHLARLVDDLLDVARITHGRLALERQPEPLAPLLQAAVEAVRPALAEAGHALTLDIPPWPLVVEADGVRITQAVTNLLANAVKYTPDGGRIALRVAVTAPADGSADDGPRVRIEVEDSGVGLAPGDAERIFGLFVQNSGASEARRQGGLGIGLALSRRLVEMHGGRLHVASPGPALGSTFTIELPLLPEHLPARVVPALAPADGSSPGRRVLLLDDNPDALETLRLALVLEGHEVLVATRGLEALALVQRERPDVAILDVGLPDIDGYEVARRLRAAMGADTPELVALTGWGQRDDRADAFAAGFDAHFTKPLDPGELQRYLQHGRAT